MYAIRVGKDYFKNDKYYVTTIKRYKYDKNIKEINYSCCSNTFLKRNKKEIIDKIMNDIYLYCLENNINLKLYTIEII